MELSKDTRRALLLSLDDKDLQEELERRANEGRQLALYDGQSRQFYIRQIRGGGKQFHVIAGGGGIVNFENDMIYQLKAWLDSVL